MDDDEAPSIILTCPSDVVLNDVCPADTDTSNTGSATAIFDDNCTVASDTLYFHDMVMDSTSVGCYTIKRVWTASAMDLCGNSAQDTCSQYITLDDNEAPVISLSCPNDTTLHDVCPVDVSPENTGDITLSVTDNCGLAMGSDTTYVDSIPDALNEGPGCYVIYRKWTVTAIDPCMNENTATCTQIITISDTTPPVWDPYIPYEFVDCD